MKIGIKTVTLAHSDWLHFVKTWDKSLAVLHPVICEVTRARQHLRVTGWSYRSAAKELGCSFTQLSHVLTGRRQSRSLVTRILALPAR